MHPAILVTGGTGKTGRRVAERLTARGADVRIGSRRGEPRFDWDDPATWTAALHGVHAAYLAFFPDLAVPGAARTLGAVARAAAGAGVQPLVLLSGRGEEEAARAEESVRAAGVPLTVVRCAFFAQNFTEGALAPDEAGELVLPVVAVREPFVDVEDVADVAVAALLEDGHAGEAYELTGPRLLTFAEALAAVRPGARVRSVPMAEYTALLAAYGVTKDQIALLEYLFGAVLDGRNASLADGVARALGRAPRDLAGTVAA